MDRVNYQKELDAFIVRLKEGNLRPRLLIHSCCAPCSSYVMEYLSEYFDITMYFYNPNMDSASEYGKRADELIRLIKDMGLSEKVGAVIAPYDPASFGTIAKGHEKDPERGARCLKCYELRLRETVRFMKEYNLKHPESGFDYFATTLTLSPLKDAGALNRISEKLAAEYGVSCLKTDFKKKNGYKRSTELSREYGLYRQDYCGCVYSRENRNRAG